jgi:serine protease Do
MAVAAITDEGVAGAHAGLAHEVAAVAERLRQSTVAVRGRGPGGGSGVIWRAEGLIVTNAHVARGSEAFVELWDKRTFPAKVVARNARRDLAALTIEAGDLPSAPIADSDALRVGQLVLAVGNPLGLVGALTAGIVHAIGPTENSRGQRWVQADVRLAPGNSGGPLADVQGRVVGINSMIAGGLALAVPSNAVERFLVLRGRRPYLGIDVQPVSVPLEGRAALGLLLLAVVAGSPAEQAGLMIGDVVVGTDGRTLGEPSDLLVALNAAGSGGTVRVDLIRGGRRVQRDVVVGEQEAQTEALEDDAA